jgi:hypothetical protein
VARSNAEGRERRSCQAACKAGLLPPWQQQHHRNGVVVTTAAAVIIVVVVVAIASLTASPHIGRQGTLT